MLFRDVIRLAVHPTARTGCVIVERRTMRVGGLRAGLAEPSTAFADWRGCQGVEVAA